jgi:hypothetical protein
MRPETQRGPVRGASADAFSADRAAEDSRTRDRAQLRRDARFHRLTERLWRLGPRPIGELLLEVASGRDLVEAAEEYDALDAIAVARLGARDWPVTVWSVA